MAAHQIPQGGGRGRGERGAPAEATTSKTFDGPPKPTSPDVPPPIAAPLVQLPQPGPDPPPPPTLLYWIIAGLVLLAALLAWYIYKLRVRLAATGTGPSLFISPSAAKDGAIKGIKAFGLDKREKWIPHLLSGGEIVSPIEPALVQQIDKAHPGEAYYYLVPFGRNLASVSAVACVDGVTGEYLECTRFKAEGERNWGKIFAQWRTAASTRATIKEGKIDLHIAAGTKVGETDIGVHPHLVWKPCHESQSVFLPFRLVKIGENVRYIRLDSKVFDKLS